MIEADEQRHKMQCLAREVLNMKSPNGDYSEMKRWLDRYEKRNGKPAVEELKTVLRMEQNKREIELQKQLHRDTA